MRRNIKVLKNNVDSSYEGYVVYNEVNVCPICKATISPVHIASSLDTTDSASIIDYCRNCNNTFVTKYSLTKNLKDTSHLYSYIADKIAYSEPNRFNKHVFDDNIIDLSPQFDKIYNQALAAETYGLDEIAGIGYRKAMEFLVKDFASHENPDEAEAIKTKPLSQCIKSYIDNVRIKTLAERSAWIGNDETHYVRKHEDRDVSDMKKFIQALVYFIGMVLITEDADSMTPQ